MGDDLFGPGIAITWPISSEAESQERLKFHMSKQKDRFLADESTNYLKIVDDDSNEIISIARWHYYPQGFVYAERIGFEVRGAPAEGEIFPLGLNVELHDWMFRQRDAERDNWTVRDGPCWILMHMVTRPSQRGRGAAGMLIEWGVKKAEENGVPAYLEAAKLAMPLYEKFGFRQVGELISMDLRGHGVDLDFVIAKMAILPNAEGVN